ncbi:calcium/sodium antiporter [Aminipila sp.]|uniref:calcium/sodium antiporter n=1 Tax=Aminipila sp. TaxID=2060095 RepID=UPI001E114BE4|nr:calcium/sodium antiporter [Aminipila sp.]MBE6034204.1 calcium/sodium antiporter [Clostridiales bacterium]
MHYILLIIGFILLVKCADIFVDGSVGVAEHFNVPSFIIGLTIVAMGTSAPEAAVSITAALGGENDIATGNIIGSNIFNLLIVLGVCAVIKPIRIEHTLLARDFPLNILITILMLLFSLDFIFPAGPLIDFCRADGIVFLLLFLIYLLMLTLPQARKNISRVCAQNVHITKPIPVIPALLKIVFGLAGIILGGKLVVSAASDIAISFGISANLIGLTIVAIGTSLPELITSIVAALKGESDLAIGNVLGSNIFNVLFVLGMSCMIHPIIINTISIFDMIILLAVTAITMLFFWSNRTLNRIEGIILILLYIVYTVFIILR